MELLSRARRLRTNEAVRELARETRISKSALIYPMFVREGSGICEEIPSLRGQYHYSPDTICGAVEELLKAGINKILLFGIPEHKDEVGSSAWQENGVVQQALREIKKNFPQVYCITDVCMCEYTSHGHCGALCECTTVDNDKTLELLSKTALSHVRAGADMVAPSDMMDGRVLAIRHALDAEGYQHIPIMAYSAKYASAFYGPFRDAAGSAPSFGDRRSYQMDIHNRKEAMKEVDSDIAEGADIVMVKPALSYLDIIYQASQRSNLPLAAYSVSGEYAMIEAAAAANLIDRERIIGEVAVSIFRAGADILITYHAKEIAGLIDQGKIG
jgi:porphobilinogen synthase